MKPKNTKHADRELKKRKKLAALVNLVQLNDHDRIEQLSADRGAGDVMSESPEKDDGFIMVSGKMKSPKSKSPAAIEDEPQQKRVKLPDDANADGNTSDTSEVSKNSDELQKLKLTLTSEQYKDLKRQLRERKRQLDNVPIFRLRENGARASLDVPEDQRTPIFLTDIQHLLMSALLEKKSPCRPDRWCFLENSAKLSHTVVLILDGLSLFHYMSNESQFEKTKNLFETKLEVVLPPCVKGNIMLDLVQVPLTNVQALQLIEKHGCLETAIEMNKDPMLIVKTIFPVDESAAVVASVPSKDLPPGDKFPRTKLLLSALQMVDEGYPVPLRGELSGRFKKYVYTKEKYAPVNDHSPMFGIDCEMCRTDSGSNELTRISIVNENQETVYETLVMPNNKIIDYLTPYSGITPEIMKTVTKKLCEVHNDLQALLPPDAILVGQSLNSDLNAMKMMHPYVIDTSICFNLTGMRRRKSKLQTLAMTFLRESIQENNDGHDSVEDSLAGLNLVKMKLANCIEFGDEVLLQKKRLTEVMRIASGDSIKNNLCAHVSKRDKRTAIVTNGALQNEIKEILMKAKDTTDEKSLNSVSLFELNSNMEVVQKAREVALEHSLTIVNLHVSTEQLRLDAVEKTMEKVDKWIGKIWKTIAHNGMFVVLMGGSEDCPSGLAQISIKKNIGDVAAEVPLTV